MAVHSSASGLANKLRLDARTMEAKMLAQTGRAIEASAETVASGTPVDTGRARYNYLPSSLAPVDVGAVRPVPEFAHGTAAENLASGKFAERALVRAVVRRVRGVLSRRTKIDGTFYLTNNVKYVADLNRGGRSPQSARGRFVERAGDAARYTFRGKGVNLGR